MADARETEKDPDAFRTISEVADDLHLPQHVLRFWETRFPQIKPVKRAGGRRFYRPEDIDLLRGIQQLLYREGYTIKGVQKILKEQGIRHVQDIGVERDVAVMRSAVTERSPAQAEGAVFGGLLGLLPRRRNRGHDDPALDSLPRDVELPLPFPDAEADRDLAMDHGEPVAPLPPRAHTRERRLAERRFDDGVYEERIYEERDITDEPRGPREPRLTAAPEPRRAAVDPRTVDPRLVDPRFVDPWDAGEPPDRSVAPSRSKSRVAPAQRAPAPSEYDEGDADDASSAAPSFAPPRDVRPEPVMQRRPTRGPAARVSTAPIDELEDPLLPFMERETPTPVAAPLEERIRRLKEREAGPPEEYLPPKLRRRAGTHADETGLEPPRRAPADEARAPARPVAPSAWPELARAEAAAQHDLAVWHEQMTAPAAAPRPSRPQKNAMDAFAEDEADEHSAVTEDDLPPDEGEDWYAAPDAEGDQPDDKRDEALGDDGWVEDQRAEVHGAADEWSRNPWDQDDSDAWTDEPEEVEMPAPRPAVEPPTPDLTHLRVSAPVSARLGMGALGAASGLASPMRLPFSSPLEAAMSTPPAARRDAPAARSSSAQTTGGMPQPRPAPASQPAHEGAIRRVGPLTGPLEDDLAPPPAPEPPASSPAEPRRPAEGPWSRAAVHPAPREPTPPASPFWQGREPFDTAGSEPLESYLPPHLRKESPRAMGQSGVQPVLSRDDVHRLQAALYELGECRRLLREATEPKADTGSA